MGCSELYCRSLHQLERLMAMDTHVFTLVVERNRTFEIQIVRNTEIFGEKPAHVPLRPDLW
jgi:hypothetical protein